MGPLLGLQKPTAFLKPMGSLKPMGPRVIVPTCPPYRWPCPLLVKLVKTKNKKERSPPSEDQKKKVFAKNCGFSARHGMEWKTIFFIFHTGNFLPFYFHSIPKIFHSIFHSILKFSSIFHSILKFSSTFHSILPYQRNFIDWKQCNVYFCCFAPLECCKQPLVKVCQQYQDATSGIWYAYCTWFNA